MASLALVAGICLVAAVVLGFISIGFALGAVALLGSPLLLPILRGISWRLRGWA